MKNKKNTLLWKIDGSELSGPSYVFGTMHVKDRRAFQHIEEVLFYIDQCQTFATEFNLEEAAHLTGMEIMDLPEGQQLDLLLGPKLYAKISKVFLRETGLEMGMFNNCLPILITNLLSEKILSVDMPHSLDETLWKYARSKDKVVLGVESFEDQLRILRKIPLKHQLKSLASIARNFKKFRKQLLKMTSLYESANLRKLHKSARKSVSGMRKLMLYDRNIIMADRIAELAAEQSLFAAVGAGHLGGKKGVLSLLKAKGLRLKPVNLKERKEERD